MNLPYLPCMTNNVFVYGSLLADEVVKVLLHRIPRNSPGELSQISKIFSDRLGSQNDFDRQNIVTN